MISFNFVCCLETISIFLFKALYSFLCLLFHISYRISFSVYNFTFSPTLLWVFIQMEKYTIYLLVNLPLDRMILRIQHSIFLRIWSNIRRKKESYPCTGGCRILLVNVFSILLYCVFWGVNLKCNHHEMKLSSIQ